MANLQKLGGLAVLVQAVMWIVLLAIFFVALPGHGFVGLVDFNNPTRLASAPLEMSFIVWSDVGFGLTMLISVFVLHRYLRPRMPLLLSAAVTIVLIGVVGWFVAHDIGFHLVGWPAIERDPASTNYAMDRALWTVRNSVFFAASLLIVLATVSMQGRRTAGSSGSPANVA